MKVYIFTSDGHRDSADLQNVAKDEEGLKKILTTFCADFGDTVLPETIQIDHVSNVIKYAYTDSFDPGAKCFSTAHFFTANLI